MTTWTEFPEVFRTRFETLVATPHALTYSIDGQNETEEDGFGPEDEFVRLVIKSGDSFQRTLGNVSRRFRTPGVAFAQIHVPFGRGDKRGRQLADIVKAAFQGVTVSGVVFKMPSLREGGRQGSWLQFTVSIPFEFDETD